MTGTFRRRCVATVALCCAVGVAFVLLIPRQSAATHPIPTPAPNVIPALIAFDPPNPYVMPECTDITQILIQPGSIATAVERTSEGSVEADLRALGTPKVNGSYRGDDLSVDWGETVNLGAFYNAGTGPATVVFSTRLMIDLQPGEAVFASSEHTTLAALEAALTAAGWTCECRCVCGGSGCGTGVNVTIPCGTGGTSNCDFNGDACHTGQCHGTFSSCKRHWIYSCE